MQPQTMRTSAGKVRWAEDKIIIERIGFPRPAPQELPLSQIASLDHNVTIPAVFGQGGGMTITLHLLNAPAIDLEMANPLSMAQQFVAVVETHLANRALTPLATDETGAAIASAVTPVVQQVVATPIIPRAPEQMIKVYRGANCTKQFEREAKQLAHKGWRVQSQSYGGQTSKAGAVIMFGVLGLAAGTKPREMTVIYVRN